VTRVPFCLDLISLQKRGSLELVGTSGTTPSQYVGQRLIQTRVMAGLRSLLDAVVEVTDSTADFVIKLWVAPRYVGEDAPERVGATGKRVLTLGG